jgi:membrane protease YdiL (CAAX protease family)
VSFILNPTFLAFAALTLAFVALWAPRVSSSDLAGRWWTFPFAVALAAGLAGGIVDVRGVVVLLLYAVGCRAARQAAGTGMRVAAHAAMLLLCGGLMLHVLPGFNNPVVIGGSVLSPGAIPYWKYLNFDKATAGLFLIGLYAPELVARRGRQGIVRGFAWRFAILVGIIIALSLAVGFVRWDPKLPPWFPLWAWSILFLTVLPEEALFRGVVQTGIEGWLGSTRGATAAAVVIGAALFGLAHAGGGATYIALAAVAGVGYGCIYAATRSLAAAVLAHAGLNTIHFLLFTYPALALHS